MSPLAQRVLSAQGRTETTTLSLGLRAQRIRGAGYVCQGPLLLTLARPHLNAQLQWSLVLSQPFPPRWLWLP